MLKRFLVTLLAFVTVFMYQSQSWAAAEKAEKAAEIIQIQQDKLALMSDDAPFQIAARKGGMDNNMMWIASIFIAGLGQILMGDLWRGLKFTLLAYGVGIAGSIVTAILGIVLTASGALAVLTILPIIGLVIWLVALVFYVLNIMDAYSMSQEVAGMSKLDNEKLAQQIQLLNDTFKVSNNKAEVRVFAF